jgi:murein L,D-transpeptidase YafK
MKYILLFLPMLAFSQNWKTICSEHDMTFPPRELILVVYKDSSALEVWAFDGIEKYAHLETYYACMSGDYGPKRRQGDRQVPEGDYEIVGFNARSSYHLSMKVNYPNKIDKLEGTKPLGGDICIHGGCASVGCIAIGDDGISKLFPVAKKVKRVRVLIFPGGEKTFKRLMANPHYFRHHDFWRGLFPVFLAWRHRVADHFF